MVIYSAVVETLILVAVVFEAYVSWKNLSLRNKDRIKRTVSRFLTTLHVGPK